MQPIKSWLGRTGPKRRVAMATPAAAAAAAAAAATRQSNRLANRIKMGFVSRRDRSFFTSLRWLAKWAENSTRRDLRTKPELYGMPTGWIGFRRVLLASIPFDRDRIHFDWVLLDFTGFYRVYLGCTEFDRVVLDLPRLAGFYWVLPSLDLIWHGFAAIVSCFSWLHRISKVGWGVTRLN